MGCLSRVGCLAVLAVAGVGAYLVYGDRLPREMVRATQRASRDVTARVRSADSARRAGRDSIEKGIAWAPLETAPDDTANDASGRTARAKLQALARRTGPAFATFNAEEIAAVLAPPFTRILPRTASQSAIAVDGDRLMLRSVVELRDFGGSSALGTLLGSALGGRDTLRVSGTLESQRSGVALFHVRELQLKGINVPSALIPTVVRLIRERASPSGDSRANAIDSLPPDALLVNLPASVADVRIHDSRVTLYRAEP